MNIYDFLTSEEIEELPEDNNLAFAEIARLAENRLEGRLRELDAQQDEPWHLMQEARLGYVNVLVAAGKRLKIEPFSSTAVPTVRGFSYEDFQQFKSDLDHYLAQILFDNRDRSRNESVKLEQPAKERIRGYIHALRECIDRSNMDESMRSKLLTKLSDFEAVLENRRLKIMAATLLALEILAIPGALWGTAEVTSRLVTQIMHVVAEAKAADDEARKLPPTEPPALLEAPRSDDRVKLDTIRQEPSVAMDDSDIPF